ncbi:MAG TPA: sulfotransferase family 2 domain-containing protein [Chthoniobacteraceae bacterium]|nr:sulfotransferase family 2 domain-containing protein [Chthoniobacteraceae bacterium]
MLVSHRHRFIYTKTVKTAGTSVEVYFEPYCVPEGQWRFSHAHPEHVSDAGIVGFRGSDREKEGANWWNHMPAAGIRRQLGEELWSRYFKFAVIRNPFDKAISAFHFSQRKRRHGGLFERVRNWFHSPKGDLRTQFKQWMRNGGLVIDHDKYLIDGELCLDYFIRYEQLAQGIEHVCKTVGVPFRPDDIPRLKTGTRPAREMAEYYDPEAVDLVAARYRWELDYFGYAPPI